MFENVKKKIGRYLLNKRYCKTDCSVINYNNALLKSSDIFVIMPRNDQDFYHSLDLIKFLLNQGKRITLFLPEFKYNLIPEKDKYRFVSYQPQQATRFFLPDKTLESMLKVKEFDAVIDLNRGEDLFYSAAANIVKSKIRIGFSRQFSENCYNLQYRDWNNQLDTNYNGFLGFLKMF